MPDIRHALQISAKPEAIYPLVATGHGFSQWWAADITESGGLVDLGFFNRATVYKLKLEIGKSPAQAEWLCQSGDEWAARISSFGSRLAAREAYCDSHTRVGNPSPTISPRPTPPGARSCIA